MSDEPRILQLLEAVLDSNRTPEEVCADSPELVVGQFVVQASSLHAGSLHHNLKMIHYP